ncbi:unnamed protein product [Macrosiphum euphorbiae]|uniref:Uncharacterized protein n=1 Tax=Macrosiphum euphorbiae TaxID=13131 RepID=A0AAV0VKF4_9HEMI|nr:unnamed protein product [Macrosiphum euphorbiae]
MQAVGRYGHIIKQQFNNNNDDCVGGDEDDDDDVIIATKAVMPSGAVGSLEYNIHSAATFNPLISLAIAVAAVFATFTADCRAACAERVDYTPTPG